MKKRNTYFVIWPLILLVIICLILTGCRDVNKVNKNIRYNADNFKIKRQITVYDTLNKEVLYYIEGLCSINVDGDGDLNIICKLGPNNDMYKLTYIRMTPFITYIAEQVDYTDADKYKYTIIIKPKSIIPYDIQVEN